MAARGVICGGGSMAFWARAQGRFCGRAASSGGLQCVVFVMRLAGVVRLPVARPPELGAGSCARI